MQIIPALSGSEDCLFLNIAAPVDRQALLPVMLWLHGGADILGSGPAEGATADSVLHVIQFIFIHIVSSVSRGAY